MGYKFPIQLIFGSIRRQMDDGIFKAVQECDIHVDRDELIRALQYDRGQYEKGYADGIAAAEKARPVVRGEWISVEERLPEIVKTTHEWRNTHRKSDRVLCACMQADGKQMVKEGYMEFFNDYPKPSWKIPGTIHSVTHWMPLPEPPNCGADMRGTTE